MNGSDEAEPELMGVISEASGEITEPVPHWQTADSVGRRRPARPDSRSGSASAVDAPEGPRYCAKKRS